MGIYLHDVCVRGECCLNHKFSILFLCIMKLNDEWNFWNVSRYMTVQPKNSHKAILTEALGKKSSTSRRALGAWFLEDVFRVRFFAFQGICVNTYVFEFIWLLLCHQEHLSILTSIFITRKKNLRSSPSIRCDQKFYLLLQDREAEQFYHLFYLGNTC